MLNSINLQVFGNTNNHISVRIKVFLYIFSLVKSINVQN